MLFRQLFDAETSTYTYLVADPVTQKALLVDPVLEQFQRDSQVLEQLGLTLQYCLETHIHAYHITATGQFRKMTGCQGIVPQNAQSECADRFITNGEEITLGNIVIQAIAFSSIPLPLIRYFDSAVKRSR
jgi:glyoxylase-like metal-dependent hydrolase (beta-lactamase superfamily II)